MTPLEDGSIVEVATIGNEGPSACRSSSAARLAVRAICQVRGAGLMVPAGAFLAELARNASLRDVYDRYVPALFGQIAQAAACNRLHTNEERLSRWLLMSHDRVGVDEFSITHEFLGQMLGSRRATVTLSAGILQAAGLIRYHRGRLTIVDREGLEEVACECYAAIKAELDGCPRRAIPTNGNGPALRAVADAGTAVTRRPRAPAPAPPRAPATAWRRATAGSSWPARPAPRPRQTRRAR